MCPCKDCKIRHRACHDTCEEYKKWKEAKDAIREKRIKEWREIYFIRRSKK